MAHRHPVQLLLSATSAALPLLAGLGCAVKARAAPEISVIPRPERVRIAPSQAPFSIESGTSVVADPSDAEARAIAAQLAERLGVRHAAPAKAGGTDEGRRLELVRLSDPSLGEEGYELHIDESAVRILASAPAGLFYGAQTLLSLTPAGATGEHGRSLPSLSIRDRPRFRYRGIHLDVARHMFPVPFIEELIDVLAMHKMNTLHLHLTDDQGWRFEVKQYPLLTEIGAFRIRAPSGAPGSGVHDEPRYGGFYKQTELRRLVAYARCRFPANDVCD
ncbi:MAG: family 20 glycosylhydrolase [Polyangiaceae bacterium]|nr:family 20 glycosylhydrolase [Polyangiaceae bacterium]